eukprot:gene10656-14311_t
MGATASIELQKPPDASDILESNSLEFAKSEIIRLRKELGHLAGEYKMDNMLLYDASDLVHGMDEKRDFQRCVEEIRHIRSCLRLSTQSSIRRLRKSSDNDMTINSPAVTCELDYSDDDQSTRDSEESQTEYKS